MFEITESTYCYIQNPIEQLNISKLKIDVKKLHQFEVLIAYSYDGSNYSEFLSQEQYEDKIIDDTLSLYVCIWFHKLVQNDLSKATKLYDKPATDAKYYGNYTQLQNVDSSQAYIIVDSIFYDNKQQTIKFKEYFDIINQYPKWNFYDNQQVTIRRWLDQCNALAESYGHTVIYFKTEPVNTELESQSGIHGIHHTLATNVIRNVVDIKKLHIMIPNNEIPQDRVIYSDWDMPLQDDFMIHIVRQKFEQAFGLKSIPNDKDYIYFPLLNKLYRVSTFQPKNGLMGVVGWYEVFLAKYEEDDCVRIDSGLKQNTTDMFSDIMGGISGVINSIDVETTSGIDEFDSEPEHISEDELKKELNEMLSDTIYSGEKINQETVEEKKEATQNFTNRLEDTTFYVSLKETEKLRELYDKRIEIAIVNPDDSLFPINMYNCIAVPKRSVAMRYNLTDYSVTNKFSNLCKNSWQICFDFVLTNRFATEIFDILSNNNVITSIKSKGLQLQIFDTTTQSEIIVSYKFEKNELYQVVIRFDITTQTYAYQIYKLETNNPQKSLVYQNVNKIGGNSKNIEITNINIYGGSYLVGNIQFYVDKQKFIDDQCTPLLNTYRF